MQVLRILEDVVLSDAAPSHRGLAVDLDPLPRGTPIRLLHAPAQFPHTIGALDRRHPQGLGPWGILAVRSLDGSLMELRDLRVELGAVLRRESPEIPIEPWRGLEFQSLGSSASRCARNSSGPS